MQGTTDHSELKVKELEQDKPQSGTKEALTEPVTNPMPHKVFSPTFGVEPFQALPTLLRQVILVSQALTSFYSLVKFLKYNQVFL